MGISLRLQGITLNGSSALATLVSDSVLTALLRRISGRRILLLDTCHASVADGRNNPYALSKRSTSGRVAVLSVLRGEEISWEAFDADRGAFTQALLKALNGKAWQEVRS